MHVRPPLGTSKRGWMCRAAAYCADVLHTLTAGAPLSGARPGHNPPNPDRGFHFIELGVRNLGVSYLFSASCDPYRGHVSWSGVSSGEAPDR
jgi:hypothetical protein